MRLEGPSSRQKAPATYRSPLHGPADAPRERQWLRFQVQAHHPKRYWEPVAESDDRNRALLEALKRARVGKLAYRVWDRDTRKEIWQGFGPHASIDEWLKERPPGLVGQNSRDKTGKGKRGRFSYIVLVTKGWFGPFRTKERAMSFLAGVRRKIRAGVASPLYEGQGEPVIGMARRSPHGWEYALPGTQAITYHYDKARDAILRAISRRPRPNDRRTAMSIRTRPARLRVNPVLSKRMQALRPGTMRLGDAMRYGKALLEAGYVIRVWDGSGWEVVIHPNDSMATSSGKGASGGRDYLARGAGMVKTWPITLIAYRGQQSLGWMTPGKIRTLLARPTVSANSGADTPTFFVMHVSVDGAGIHTKGIALKRKAIALAQKLQAKSDRRGNPFGYHYIVYRQYPSGRSDAIYRTKSRPKASANWNSRKRALMNSPKVVQNYRLAHRAIVGAFLSGRKKSFGTSQQQAGTRYVTDGQKLLVWGNLVAEKVPGGIRIRDAGWRTLLTKNVLNEILDQLGKSRISQMKHEWYLGRTPWEGEAVIPTGAMANRRRRAKSRRSRRNAFAKTPYYQIKGKIHHWESGQPAKLPKGKTLVTVYIPGVDATVFETWFSGGERHWKALRMHRHHSNPLTRAESGQELKFAREAYQVGADMQRAGKSPAAQFGYAQGIAGVVGRRGGHRAAKVAERVMRHVRYNRRARKSRRNCDSLLGKRGARSAMRFA